MITFWGGTDEVTGSMTFIEFQRRFVLVDCGLAQGLPEVEKLNYLPLPFHPSELQAVVVTHAHLDHSGFLPRLVKKGFGGEIFCTPATAKLMRIILLDSAGLMDDGLYDEKDVQDTLRLVRTVEFNKSFLIGDATFKFLPAGHILGAASVQIGYEGKRIVFSGDLGRNGDPLIPPPAACPEANIVMLESTYGGKLRQGNMEKELYSFLTTLSREGRVGILASFAVARAQLLIYLIYEFFKRHPEEKFRVVLDGRMLVEANKVYRHYAALTNDGTDLPEALEHFEVIDHPDEWKSLQKKQGPLLIIASSGMLTGGRVWRHLANWQNDARAILFLSGYQAKGTPGREMKEGKRNFMVKDVQMNWQGEVWTSDAFSSHADQSELLAWAKDLSPETKIFLLHGEQQQKEVLKKALEAQGHDHVVIAGREQKEEL